MTSVRKAARALHDASRKITAVARLNSPLGLPDELPLHSCTPHAWPTLGDLRRVDEAETQLKAALDAPQPGLEDVREALWNLWHQGRATATTPFETWDAVGKERDRLIAELLAMWEGR